MGESTDLGQSEGSRYSADLREAIGQFNDLWIAFLREIEDEIGRHRVRLASLNVQADRTVRGRPAAGMGDGGLGGEYAYEPARESQRRFS